MEKETKKVEKQIDYTEYFKKITVCLYIVIAFLFVNTILLMVSINGNDSSKNTNNEETETYDYDTSAFTEMTTDQAIQSMKSSDMQVIFVGRSGCGYCAQFIPVLEEAQDKFGFKTTYIDLDKVTSDDAQKWLALDEYVSENFGYTPFVILAKDGKYVDGIVGYMEYNSLASFLEENGMSQK